jgi:hypothetical protein
MPRFRSRFTAVVIVGVLLGFPRPFTKRTIPRFLRSDVLHCPEDAAVTVTRAQTHWLSKQTGMGTGGWQTTASVSRKLLKIQTLSCSPIS